MSRVQKPIDTKFVSKLLKKIVCPNCWFTFEPGDIVWISSAPDLVGDSRLGETEQERFLPTQFDTDGHAIDRKGYVCREVACPHCHLRIPYSVLEMQPYFISIVGAPASGKSYFLASMTWRLGKVLAEKFFVGLTDADPRLNQRLHEYESLQFLNDDMNALVKIEKTEEQGDLYNTILVDDQQITYPQPFIFSLSPLRGHKYEAYSQKTSTSLCLYDNAGESYLPVEGSDRSTLPVTQHLGKSNCIFFLFDPLQDNRFRSICRTVSNDPQLREETRSSFRKSPLRQEQVLAEMIKRTRSYRNMSATEKYPNPVVVIVTKLDAWRRLLPELNFQSRFWVADPVDQMRIINLSKVREVSQIVRKFLASKTPEIISSVEQFATDVVYIPVSATGASPIVNPNTFESGFRTKNVAPIWVEIPMLYALARSTQGVIRIIE